MDEYLPWERVVRLSAYQRPMDQWITAMKFGSDWSRAVWFGRQLAREIRSVTPADRTVVCPVPMHWLRCCHRGYNQAELIGRAVAQTNGFRVADVLRRVRYTRPQTTVAVSRRDINLGRFVGHRPGRSDGLARVASGRRQDARGNPLRPVPEFFDKSVHAD